MYSWEEMPAINSQGWCESPTAHHSFHCSHSRQNPYPKQPAWFLDGPLCHPPSRLPLATIFQTYTSVHVIFLLENIQCISLGYIISVKYTAWQTRHFLICRQLTLFNPRLDSNHTEHTFLNTLCIFIPFCNCSCYSTSYNPLHLHILQAQIKEDSIREV